MQAAYFRLLTRRGATRALIRTSGGLALLGVGSALYSFSRKQTVHLDAGETSGSESTRNDGEAKLRQEERFAAFDADTGVNCFYMTSLAR